MYKIITSKGILYCHLIDIASVFSKNGSYYVIVSTGNYKQKWEIPHPSYLRITSDIERIYGKDN